MFDNIPFLTILFTILIPLGAYVVKVLLLNRLQKIEEDLKNMSTKPETKELINLKLDPITEDIKEIKSEIQYITQLLLNQRHN